MSNIFIESNSNFPISINTLQQKNSTMSMSNIIQTYLKIINRILEYTSDIKCPSSIFDMNKQNNIETDSDSENENNSIIEKNDIENFIIRCIQLLDIKEEIVILSMMTLDKLLKNNLLLCENNLPKVIFICLMLTHKYYNDNDYISNTDYSKICGISTDELLKMELEFMNIIDFNMNINEDDYIKYCDKIKKFWLNILY